MINFFYSSIINYKAIHKSNFIENYVQAKINLENEEIFFTNQ